MATRTQLAAALGPRRPQAPAAAEIPRSKYLANALQSLQSTPRVQSWGELAADLGAVALTEHGRRRAEKSEKAEAEATVSNKNAALLRALDSFGQSQTGATPPIAPTTPAPSEPVPSAAMPMSAGVQKPMASAQPPMSPDIDAQVRTVWGEGRGEPPQGQQAIANVILNRATGRGMSPGDVVRQPHQFEPWGNPQTRQQMEGLSQQDPTYQAILQNIQPALQGQDVTGGADHFYSPGAQSALGRGAPSWDNGKGVDLGRHRFFDLEQPKPGAQPYDVAALGQPPAPPQDAPQPPPPEPPQAAPEAQQGPDPRQQQIGVIRSLLSAPETADLGQQLLVDLLSQQASPDKGYSFSTLTQQGQVIRLDPRTGKAEVAYQGPSDARGDEYGLTPIPIEVDGQVRLFQPSKSGGMREIPLPEGGRFAKPVTMVDQGTSRVGIDPLTGRPITEAMSTNVADVANQGAQGRTTGEAQATARINLPNALASGQQTLDVLNSLLSSDQLDARTGLSGVLPAIPGTKGVGFDSQVAQVQGKAFLQAYQDLRGTGAISEIEGKKAEQAQARLNRAQSAEDFRQALTDLRDVVMAGMERARQRAAGGMPSPAGQPQAAPAGGGWTEVAPGVRIRPKG